MFCLLCCYCGTLIDEQREGVAIKKRKTEANNMRKDKMYWSSLFSLLAQYKTASKLYYLYSFRLFQSVQLKQKTREQVEYERHYNCQNLVWKEENL